MNDCFTFKDIAGWAYKKIMFENDEFYFLSMVGKVE